MTQDRKANYSSPSILQFLFIDNVFKMLRSEMVFRCPMSRISNYSDKRTNTRESNKTRTCHSNVTPDLLSHIGKYSIHLE